MPIATRPASKNNPVLIDAITEILQSSLRQKRRKLALARQRQTSAKPDYSLSVNALRSPPIVCHANIAKL
jgi:hypothetical protein